MKITNKQIADVFRAAKNLLHHTLTTYDDKGSSFICVAIKHTELEGASCAREIVEERLNCYTIEQWLHENGHREDNCMSDEVQAYRHAWLDSLIKEFENKPV